VRAGIVNPSSLGPNIKKRKKLEKEKKVEDSRQIEEIRMLDDIPNNPLASFKKCTLDEVFSILQNDACDPTINTNQAGFNSYIANHVIKENLDMYNKESMVPSKLGDVWEPRIYVTIGKITWPAILDLKSSVSTIHKSLCHHLDLCPTKKCNFNLLLADFSIKHALGRVDNVLVELHMTYVSIDFIIMDMDGNNQLF
jgi:hypothetical protein